MSELDVIELRNYKLSTENDLNHLIQTVTLSLSEKLSSQALQTIVEECKNLHENYGKCDVVVRLIEEIWAGYNKLQDEHEKLNQRYQAIQKTLSDKTEEIFKEEDRVEELKEQIKDFKTKLRRTTLTLGKNQQVEDEVGRRKKIEIDLEYQQNQNKILNEKCCQLVKQLATHSCQRQDVLDTTHLLTRNAPIMQNLGKLERLLLNFAKEKLKLRAQPEFIEKYFKKNDKYLEKHTLLSKSNPDVDIEKATELHSANRVYLEEALTALLLRKKAENSLNALESEKPEAHFSGSKPLEANLDSDSNISEKALPENSLHPKSAVDQNLIMANGPDPNGDALPLNINRGERVNEEGQANIRNELDMCTWIATKVPFYDSDKERTHQEAFQRFLILARAAGQGLNADQERLYVNTLTKISLGGQIFHTHL